MVVSMRSLPLFMAVAAASTGAARAISEASNSSSASSASSSVQWCANTVDVLLTTCGSVCGDSDEEQACAQYPANAKTKCGTEAGNKCVVHDASCTYQCLDVYNSMIKKWTLFVKEPQSSDNFGSTKTDVRYPVAPVENIMGFQIPADAKNIQLTGFDTTTVNKGSTKSLKLDNNMFEKSETLDQLNMGNIDLSKLATNFLPKSVSTLLMDNCKLSDVPPDVANMANIRTLNISKNMITDLPSADSKIVKTLQSLTTLNLRANALTTFNWVLPSLTTLDLGDNKLTTFPTAVFNMTKLTSLSLDGNNIPSISVTSDQLNFLKRLTASSSSLGASPAATCAAGARQETVLGVAVCVADLSTTTAPAKESSSSNIGLIAGIAAGVVVVIVIVGVFCYCRRSKTKANSEFYVSVMENGNNNQNNTGGNSGNGYTGNSTGAQSRSGGFFSRSRASSGGRRPSVQSTSNRPSRGPSLAGKPSIVSNPEMGVYQEQLSNVNSSSTLVTTGTVNGSRQRQRAQINQNVVRIAASDINYTRTMAKGAHGEVWLAHMGRDLVAVKKLITTDPDSVGAFVGELNLLASLSHPRILTLVGGCWTDDMSEIQIVLEFMDSGDLLTVLRNKTPEELTWEKAKAAYCVQICEAVYYLHSLQPALIHRDIKSRNILVDARKGAKLSDFGESRERTVLNTMTAGVGTARWVAPEIILGEDYSELADIYSLGVLLTELDTHQIPFEGLKLEEHMIVQQVAVGKLRPKVSDSCPEVIRRLAHECLQFDPQLRPTAARVLQTLMASPLGRRLSTISDSE